MSRPETIPRFEYDLPTAVTFLIVGLAVGSVLTILFSPRTNWPEIARSAKRGSETVQPVE
jgi:hypothetical protein